MINIINNDLKKSATVATKKEAEIWNCFFNLNSDKNFLLCDIYSVLDLF